jgi:flavin-dependent dehydrogenase
LAIFSRVDLNALLLRRAELAGAEIVCDRISGFARSGGGWEVKGRKRTYRADYLVLAAGARSLLRGLLTESLHARDFMVTFGYYVPGRDEIVRIQFYRDFEGYAWAFPRPDHYSIGICAKFGESSIPGMRERLHAFMDQFGYRRDSSPIYSHVLPALTPASWCDLRLNGEGWALAGDAGGLVDPITGEGIYYALRSGELIAESLLEGAPHRYAARLAQEFGRSLTVASRLARVFYNADFLRKNLTTRLVELSAASRAFATLTEDLVTGSLPYNRLVARISRILPCALPGIFMNGLREGLSAIFRGSSIERMASISP